jgi:hypothetical protein
MKHHGIVPIILDVDVQPAPIATPNRVVIGCRPIADPHHGPASEQVVVEREGVGQIRVEVERLGFIEYDRRLAWSVNADGTVIWNHV